MTTKRTRTGAGAPDGFTAVIRVSPTQQVREQLLNAIQNGDYPPGTALPSERVLCERFGVSRVSVREAIAGLEAMGLITVQHGRGAFVRDSVHDQYAGPFGTYLSQHRDQLLELLRVRGALDQLAAEEAALRGTKKGLAALVAANDAFNAAAAEPTDRPDYGRLATLDVAFHVAIARATDAQLLPTLVAELNDILDESRRMTLSRPGQRERSTRQHGAIVAAILNGDAAKARRAAERHLSDITAWIGDLPDAATPAQRSR
jgi:DNA-binding FadR family transcriptional regulator